MVVRRKADRQPRHPLRTLIRSWEYIRPVRVTILVIRLLAVLG